jgi:hypothetical protein
MSALTLTRHAMTRMAQRSITLKDAELIAMIGTEVEGGYLVREKDYQNIERTLKGFLERSRRLVGKRLVLASGGIITTYHASPRSERRLLQSARDSNLD